MFDYKKSTKFKTLFAGSIETIRCYLCDIGNTYLLICYNVWEINANQSYIRAGYKNIVEALEKELGFKKSTTYNMLNVVKTYGADEKGKISYKQLMTFSKFSYSQLVEMLSLGSEQREKVTPETPVSAIRMLKKSEEAPVSEASASEASAASVPAPVAEEFQTSGKSSPVVEHSEVLESFTFRAPNMDEVEFQYSINIEDDNVFCSFNKSFLSYFDEFLDQINDLYDYVYLKPSFLDYDPDDLEERFSYIISVYRSAYDAYRKQLYLKDKSAV